MWPILLDMTKDECKRTLRRLELEAYGNIVSALRAQGGLSTEKHKLLKDLATALNIPQERHRAEVRRAVNDERLATIAHCMTGDDTSDEWALEGRRLVPLMPRLVPQTAYSVIADDEANKVSLENEKLPLPANTERKRPLQTSLPETLNKNIHFRVPSESTPKATIQNNIEDINNKKRKSTINMESSSLAQHLIMGQPKISRVQQLYRQKTKAILKSQMKHRAPPPIHHINTNVQKLNIMKADEDMANTNTITEVPIPLLKPSTGDSNKVVNTVATNPPISNENQIPKPKPTVIHTTVKTAVQSTNNLLVPQQTPIVSSSSEVAQKSIKICPARKVITTTAKTQSTPQKVIIVSTPQGTTTSSILQRTLTIPFVKTISMKTLDKVKVINNPANLQNSSGTANVSNAVSQKPKLYTVKGKSGAPTKHVSIPFIQGVQLQALQSKGAIKMVPLTTTAKSSKSAVISTTSGSVYIMNSSTTLPIVTASNSSPVVTPKTDTRIPAIDSTAQESETNNFFILKNDDKKSTMVVSHEENSEKIIEIEKAQKADSKSSVLAEIMKASGVLPNDEAEQNDIESQITQLTEIPNNNIVANEVVHNEVVQNEVIHDEIIENEVIEHGNEIMETCTETVIQENSQDVEQFQQIMNSSPDATNFVILQDNPGATEMLLEEPQHTNEEVVELMGSLDPETGMYSVKTAQEYELMQDVETSQAQITEDSYVIEMESLNNSDLDMPSLSN